MSIEIRPSAVIGQIEEKSGKLSALLSEVTTQRANALQFVQDTTLQGAGYDAARSRMSGYIALLTGIDYSIQRTLQIDTQISSALSGYFGECGRVSEQEWLDKKSEAEGRLTNLENQLSYWRDRCDIADSSVVSLYNSAIGSAWDDINFARDMLSKIYSYCSETNGAYSGDLASLNDGIARGSVAFFSSGYNQSSGKWGSLDTSWEVVVAQKVVKIADDVSLEKSRLEPDQAFLSADCQYMYFNGEKWRISGGSVSGYPWNEDGAEQMRPGWANAGEVSLSYEDFESFLFLGYLLSGLIQSGENAKPNQPSGGLPLGVRETGVAWANGAVFAAITAGASAEAVDRATKNGSIKFVFEKCGTVDKRVAIYAAGDSATYNRWKDNTLVSSAATVLNSNGMSYRDSVMARFMTNSTLDDLYQNATGNNPSGKLSLGASFNHDARSSEDAYTGQYFFSDSEGVVERVVQYPEDKVYLFEEGKPPVDVTKEWFNQSHIPNEKVKKEIENAAK